MDFGEKDILVVEKAIRCADDYPTIEKLEKLLPKKFGSTKLKQIISRLADKNKILIDSRDGAIVWIWNPELAKKLRKRGLIVR